jgi:hypothetical protein
MVFSTAGFAGVFPEKRLELKSLKGRTKAEELRQLLQRQLLNESDGEQRGLSESESESGNLGKTAEPREHRGGTDPLLKYI